MIDLVVRVLINTLAFVVAVKVVPHIEAPNDIVKLLAIGLILGLINSYLKPIVKALAFPITLVTLGLVGLVINGALLLLVAFISKQFGLGFEIDGWPTHAFHIGVLFYAILAAIVISIVSTILAFFFGTRRVLGIR
jgi:putative membrane protein